MAIQIANATPVTDKRITNALKRRLSNDYSSGDDPNGEYSWCNEIQKSTYHDIQQYYVEYRGKQYIGIERNGRYHNEGVRISFYEFSWKEFPTPEFIHTNSFKVVPVPNLNLVTIIFETL